MEEVAILAQRKPEQPRVFERHALGALPFDVALAVAAMKNDAFWTGQQAEPGAR